ncbi:Alcohol dehydrogenase transcription factor Myb/SANT-like family protein [Euphorbia peplus]|nr:Alcohol dehydrogenase transcription factor Myb/SANT-like family protein [Euphorbia peplus]
MDDTEDDARYPPNHQQGFGSSNRQKLPVRNAPYSREVGVEYVDDDDEDENEEDEEEEEEEMGEEDGDNNNNQNNGIVRYVVKGEEGDEDDDEEDEEEDVDVDEEEDEVGNQKIVRRIADADMERHPKKRKMKSLISSYEFAPRVPATPVTTPSATKTSFVGRNPLTDWTEHETFVLLDAWGEKFLLRGRKSLRSDEWHEVAEKVSEVSKIERTDTQCRNRLDTLKKKYKKEKSSLVDGSGSKWVYFRKMDMLLSTSAQQGGLSCGVDSGEYVFMNPRVYLNRANGSDEMRDSPGNSESAGEDDDSDGLPPKKRRSGRDQNEGSSFRVLADSIHKFSEIYEKIESSKRQQMLELEKMRMDFQKDLEMQKRQIMERAHAEIAKLRQIDEEENDISGDNASG